MVDIYTLIFNNKFTLIELCDETFPNMNCHDILACVTARYQEIMATVT